MKPAIVLLSLSMLAALPNQAAAWGDDGHKVVALIAQNYLTPATKKQVDALLAADTDNLTAHDIASEASGPTSIVSLTTKRLPGTSPISRSQRQT